MQAFDLEVVGQDEVGELLQGQPVVFVFVAVLEQLHYLPVSAHLAQHLPHVLQVNVPLSVPVVEGEHLLESGHAGLGQHSLLCFFLGFVYLDFVLHVEVHIILLAPGVNNGDVLWGQIRVYFE